MLFVGDGYFPNSSNITNSQWNEVLQQHQRIVYDCSVGVRVSVGHLNVYKGYWYHIKLVWTDGNPRMLLYDNAG